uniref:Ig-like domain-containing protein n=1 Tax=Magallana gigas TaxID=29159 RepID=K1PLS6_MAGGI
MIARDTGRLIVLSAFVALCAIVLFSSETEAKGISSLTLKTKDVIFEDGDSIILNCTYFKINTEYIAYRTIKWQKLIGDVFKNIALFSPPGGYRPYIPYEMQPFYNNRTELIAPNISRSAVMIIKDPICSDQGVYRCWIEYYSENSVKEQTNVPDKPVITLTPLKSLYFVGDYLTIQCITDSNPPPVFTWKFQPHNKSLETVIKKSPDISKLVFDTLKTTDSGTYSCMATNAARLNSANVTSSVSIYVSHSEISNQGCNQCGYITVCQQYDGKTECVTNKWVPIAIVFILISVSFAVASIVLIKNKSASQDDGGYQAHAEIANTHVGGKRQLPVDYWRAAFPAPPFYTHGHYLRSPDLISKCD